MKKVNGQEMSDEAFDEAFKEFLKNIRPHDYMSWVKTSSKDIIGYGLYFFEDENGDVSVGVELKESLGNYETKTLSRETIKMPKSKS